MPRLVLQCSSGQSARVQTTAVRIKSRNGTGKNTHRPNPGKRTALNTESSPYLINPTEEPVRILYCGQAKPTIPMKLPTCVSQGWHSIHFSFAIILVAQHDHHHAPLLAVAWMGWLAFLISWFGEVKRQLRVRCRKWQHTCMRFCHTYP